MTINDLPPAEVAAMPDSENPDAEASFIHHFRIRELSVIRIGKV